MQLDIILTPIILNLNFTLWAIRLTKNNHQCSKIINLYKVKLKNPMDPLVSSRKKLKILIILF